MLLRILILAVFGLLAMTACTTSQQLPPDRIQPILIETWQVDQHIVWELDWPAAPIGGPLTVETWRTGNRYRFEILEAATPALVGETLVFDGQLAWRYNRFDPPATFLPTLPKLSPVSDAFIVVDRLINTLPETTTRENAQVNSSLSQKITAIFANGDSLTLWRDVKTGLPSRVVIIVTGQHVTLNARDAERVLNPPDELFEVGEWLR